MSPLQPTYSSTRTTGPRRHRRPSEPRLPTALDRRFEAVVFDWNGTDVPGRDADARELRALVEELFERGRRETLGRSRRPLLLVPVVVTLNARSQADERRLRSRTAAPSA